MEQNNQALMSSTKDLQNLLARIKRANTESADSHIKEIKKLKYDDPHRFRNKACEDQYKFNLRVQDSLDEAKDSVTTIGLEKAKVALDKGESSRATRTQRRTSNFSSKPAQSQFQPIPVVESW